MNATSFQLRPLELVNGLEITSNSADFHHDLMMYLDYVGTNSVKRSQRDNRLTKNDVRELTRLMSRVTAAPGAVHSPQDAWLAMIEFVAWKMALVSFSYHEDNFSDFLRGVPGERENFINVNQSIYKKFISLSPVQQEEKIRTALIEMQLKYFNELYDPTPVGRLDQFAYYMRNSSNATIGDFQGARTLLLSLLASLPGGTWYSVADLVAYLKANHANFLLPAQIQKKPGARPSTRYAGFAESPRPGAWSSQEIKESDADSFERIEGRFVERFLESLPLMLRYIEVAYDPGEYQGMYPMRNRLRAFRVNDRFIHLVQGRTPPPRVTIQPNFEVTIISEVYPSDLMQQLLPLGEIVNHSTGQAGPSVVVLRLKKDRVAARVAAQPDLNVAELLQKISGQSLSQNVVAELSEWSAHSETFTVYEGYDLLEIASPLPSAVAGHLVKAQVTPNIYLVKDLNKIVPILVDHGEIVLTIEHFDHQISELDDHAQTVFATISRPLKVQQPVQTVVVKREEKVILRFNGQREAFDALRLALAELNVPVETIDRETTILVPKVYEPQLEAALTAITDRFIIQIA